jgi:plasmid stabilization system protein ParE
LSARAGAVKLTANFEANLLTIESFWGEAGPAQRYAHLLDELLDTVIPTLEAHPRIGRSFLERPAHSVEATALIGRTSARIGRGELREFLAGDYLILYASISDAVYLLAIQHHHQLSFDFEAFWPT